MTTTIHHSTQLIDPSRVSTHTFGCKVNTYDTGLIQESLSEEFELPIHIVNTCAVTMEATQSAVKHIRWYKRCHPQTLVVVTGCATQVETEVFNQLKEADLVIANSHKDNIQQIIKDFVKKLPIIKKREGHTNQTFKSNIFKTPLRGGKGGREILHTRSFLKIQDGCDSFCTYCVIPFARGKSKSFSIDSIVNNILSLEEQGIQEVVLTGIHIGDYRDPYLKSSFPVRHHLENLLQAILKHTTICRIRLTSFEPIELTEGLLNMYSSEERLCPHFHISVQSICESVLKKMKRQYSAGAVLHCLNKIHQKLPQAFVGLDIITGFPTESQKDYDETYTQLEHLPWTRAHIFPYSPRPYTLAARSAPLPSLMIKNRTQQLIQLSLRRYGEAAQSQVGSVKQALILKNKHALSRDFWTIKLDEKSLERLFLMQTKAIQSAPEVRVKVKKSIFKKAQFLSAPIEGEALF